MSNSRVCEDITIANLNVIFDFASEREFYSVYVYNCECSYIHAQFILRFFEFVYNFARSLYNTVILVIITFNQNPLQLYIY